ncbi:MAG: DUF222 domain-containing protein [Jatrophihabitans endophyticus]|nr:DUF222 domain-containing protein [Jatrophihabitans endophyticus]
MTASRDDVERIDRIRHFEQLKAAIAAAQAAETAAFAASQRAAHAAQGVPAGRRDRGIAGQVALARRMSHHAAQRYVGWSVVLTRELPQTFAALRAGGTTEYRAMTIAKETVFLSREGRAEVDRQLARRLGSMSDRSTEVEARKLGYALDPDGFLARSRRAAGDRHVSVRPAPDTMARVTALVPVAQGVACYASLSKAADTHRSDGDPRSRGQVMADLFVERLTGQATADAVGVGVEVVLPADVLLGDDSSGEPALVTAPGLTPTPVPAELARELIASAPTAWVRRLFARPDTGALVAMETRGRLFTDGQRDFLRHRDQFCATPSCGAPIRHADHVIPSVRGGPTRLDHGRGLCEACNYAAQAPGWRSRPLPDGSIETVTPTGHRYVSPPPTPFAPITVPPPDQAERLSALQRGGRLCPAA